MKMWVITNRYKVEEREGDCREFGRYGMHFVTGGSYLVIGRTAFNAREVAIEVLRGKHMKAQMQFEKLSAALRAAEQGNG